MTAPTITLSLLQASDAQELLAGLRRSQALHAHWLDAPRTAWEVKKYLMPSGPACIRYGIRSSKGELAAVVNLNGIIRGAFQNGFLGYFALAPHHGRGFVRAGVKAVTAEAFAVQGLHRLEANIQPDNRRSAALIRSLGFRLEGHSPRYLKIGGAWRDHDRYALTKEESVGS